MGLRQWGLSPPYGGPGGRNQSASPRIHKPTPAWRKFGHECPVISASNIHYEIAHRMQAISAGEVGMIHQLVKALDLDKAINLHVNLLKIYMPYNESDHVLNVAYIL